MFFCRKRCARRSGLARRSNSTHLVNPDIAFALDTGTAGDTPGMTPKEADSILGKGPQILIFDASMISAQKIMNFVIDVAEEMAIPFQYTVISGGGNGCRTNAFDKRRCSFCSHYCSCSLFAFPHISDP